MKTIISLSNDIQQLSSILGSDCKHVNTAKVAGGTEHILTIPKGTPSATMKFADEVSAKVKKELGSRVAAT